MLTREHMRDIAQRPRTHIRALKRKITLRGLSVVDKRSHGAKALFAWRDEMIAAMGGAVDASPQKKAIVEMVVRTKLYIDHIDSYLMGLPTLLNKRKKSVWPVVRERQQLCDSLARMLSQLGLERQMKRIPTLEEYLSSPERAAAQKAYEESTEANVEVKPEEEATGLNE